MFLSVPCGVAGTIPVSIGNLTNLTYLNLWYNALTGPFACLVESEHPVCATHAHVWQVSCRS